MSKSIEIVVARHLPKQEGGYRHKQLAGGISSETYKIEPVSLSAEDTALTLTIIRDPLLWWKVNQEFALRNLIAGDNEVPLPELYDAGFDDIDGERIAYILREFVQGFELDVVLQSRLGTLSQEQDISSLAQDLGCRLGKMHRHGGALFGQLGKSREILYPSWASFILSEVEIEMRLIAELNGDLQLGIVNVGHIQTLLPQLEMLIGSLQSSLLRVSLPHLTHGDAHFKNIIASQNADQTWKVKSFIDTDEALGGDPEIDIAYIENWLYFSDYKNEFFGCKENFQFGYASECKTNLKYEDRRLIYHCLRSLSYLRTVFGFDTQEFLLANPRNMEYVAKHFDILRSLAEGNALEDLNIPALI